VPDLAWNLNRKRAPGCTCAQSVDSTQGDDVGRTQSPPTNIRTMKQPLSPPPGKPVRLADYDPEFCAGLDKVHGKSRVEAASKKLAGLQERLYAEGKRSLLVVLQAMDAGGKDGAIRGVMGPLNSQSCYVASFKKPSSLELSHDFLWRVHNKVPERGEIGVFNRSHYEDVLVVKVHKLVDDATIEKRYGMINDFERLLTESGTKILKFYLHISKEEQKQRFADRIADPEKHWKLGAQDISERKRWDDYMAAFEAAISKTNTPECPWHVVPANKKWYRDVVIAERMVAALEEMDPKYPAPAVDVSKIVLE
jgi:PPK2 family polyphosphate:nucleotide phosphotransferase